MANKTSQHILNGAANLLGFCLLVLTSMHFSNKKENISVDIFTGIIALFLTVSCAFSFMAIRTENKKREVYLERIADYLFMLSLIGIFIDILFIIFKYWD